MTTQFNQANCLPHQTCSLSYHRHHNLCLDLWTTFGFECFGSSKAGLVTPTNTIHNTNRWVLRRLSFLETIGQTIDHVVWVPAVEKRHRIAFFARFVDHPVKVGDISVICPLKPSARGRLTKDVKSLPAHEHVSEVDYVCTFRWDNLRSFSMEQHANREKKLTSSHSSVSLSYTCSPSTSPCMSKVTDPKSV